MKNDSVASSADGAGATLLLVRHGQSRANAEQRFTLRDDEPLTEVGVDQARATGRLLAASYLPRVLYASPYARALATAREIGAFFGLEPQVVPELHEQSFGELRGRPYSEYYPVARALSGADLWRHRPPGGESLGEVAARTGPAIDRIAESHPGEQVLVVSHGGVMAALRAHVAGGFLQPPQPTPNAGGYRLVGSSSAGYRGPLPLWESEPTPAGVS